MDDFVVSDAITDLERSFPFKELLELDYFQKYRGSYYRCNDEGRQIPPRNYYNLLQFLTDIHEYQLDDAKTFVKAFRTSGADWRNSEATFAEVIVYRYYVRLVYEDIIRAVRHGREECDIIVNRLDGSTAFLEVFSIMPNLSEVGVNNITTHTQDEMASVRQKLLRKIREQKQMTKARDNYAVIELNNSTIAPQFCRAVVAVERIQSNHRPHDNEDRELRIRLGELGVRERSPAPPQGGHLLRSRQLRVAEISRQSVVCLSAGGVEGLRRSPLVLGTGGGPDAGAHQDRRPR